MILFLHFFLNLKKTDYESLEVQSSFNKSKRNIWLLPSDKVIGKTKPFVDYQNDATAKDIKLALREGFRSIEHVKRYTTTGMGTDQGKLGNMHALGIISETAGSKMGELGTTTFRPPYTPLTFGTIVGRNVGEYFDIFRKHIGPALQTYNPNFILLSAGFDAHWRDPLGDIRLTTEGFRTLSRMVAKWAGQQSQGRLVSVLEGGYDLEGLCESTQVHLEALIEA